MNDKQPVNLLANSGQEQNTVSEPLPKLLEQIEQLKRTTEQLRTENLLLRPMAVHRKAEHRLPQRIDGKWLARAEADGANEEATAKNEGDEETEGVDLEEFEEFEEFEEYEDPEDFADLKEMEELEALAESADTGKLPKRAGPRPNTRAVRLNEYWNSLSLGADMYDSLFSFKAETSHIWPDPLVWNIIYAAVPAGYSIPDPAFVASLKTYIAWQLLKATLPEKPVTFERFLAALAQVPGKPDAQQKAAFPASSACP